MTGHFIATSEQDYVIVKAESYLQLYQLISEADLGSFEAKPLEKC